MAAEIRMPQFGVSMETGTIAQWCKAEGDPVKVGDVLASIETAKLTNDVISEVDGVLLKIVAPEGEDVPVQGLMAYVGQPGEVLPGGTAAAPAAPAAGSAPAVQSAEAPQPSVGRIKASPLARKIAVKLGVDLAQVTPGGTSGRVRADDVRAYAAQAPAAPAPAPIPAPAPATPAAPAELADGDTAKKLSGMRKVVAQRMLQSHTEIPPVTQVTKVDVTALMQFRRELLEKTGKKYSVNDLILKATAKCLAAHPEMLVSFDGDLTKNVILMKDEQFAQFGDGKIFFNTSIAPSFETEALERWLARGGNELFCDMPSALGEHAERLLANPHVNCIGQSAGFTGQAAVRLSEKSLNNIRAFLENN